MRTFLLAFVLPLLLCSTASAFFIYNTATATYTDSQGVVVTVVSNTVAVEVIPLPHEVKFVATATERQ